MLPKADLHIHTICSDGRLSPLEVVDIAKNSNLAAFSITDHDTIDGYNEAKEYAKELEIELIPGVEITASMATKEVHILAYYFKPESVILNRLLLSQRLGRRQRIKRIIKKLIDLGLEIDFDEVRAEADGANMGRPHIAKVLINKGYVTHYLEAFSSYLSNERLGRIEHTYPNYDEVISSIKEAGGASIVAHPGKLYSKIEMDKFIEAGIDGIECVHPSHSFALQKKYTDITKAHSLLYTGGSDYHGDVHTAHTHLGVVTVAMKYVSKMKRMTNQRKSILNIV